MLSLLTKIYYFREYPKKTELRGLSVHAACRLIPVFVTVFEIFSMMNFNLIEFNVKNKRTDTRYHKGVPNARILLPEPPSLENNFVVS